MTEPAGLAFKAYEIEELADVYFFRPVGIVFARAARALQLTPTAVTIASVIVGIAGGALLYFDGLALIGFALIIFYGVLDSSDGQLARITGRATELGRFLDGAGGYVVYVAIFVAIVAGGVARGASMSSLLPLAGLTGLMTAVHAQMYDYHRTTYLQLAIQGIVRNEAGPRIRVAWLDAVLRAYESAQRRLAASHADVEAAIAARASNGMVRDQDRSWYRSCFYWPVRGWNLLGDNNRRYAIGVFAFLHHLEYFFVFILVPMNIALAALWVWQARADRRFLDGL